MTPRRALGGATLRGRALAASTVRAHGLATASLASLAVTVAACATTGRGFMAEPLPGDDLPPPAAVGEGARALGVFRNTYYDFPFEADFSGDRVAVRGPGCELVATVPRDFFAHLCVQGSGRLADGATLSFAKRDVACAEVCPRTGSKIAFERLDPRAFPWGRGAAGRPITPLRSVAVDPAKIPLGTAVYVPEFDGQAVSGAVRHDGCFVAEDRGSQVKGQHLDVFTGGQAMTKKWNTKIPSNRGVRVYIGVTKCQGLGWIAPR